MPKWLKEIYHHVYEQNPIRFAAFLEQAINHPKDFLKKALKRNGTTIHDLTEYQLLKELNRSAFSIIKVNCLSVKLLRIHSYSLTKT